MLLGFRIKNFRSFSSEQSLSMIASSDTSLSVNLAKAGKYSVLKTAVVYGANASGKSNLIKAIGVMRDIVVDSAEYKPGKRIPVTPFRLSPSSSEEPSEFEATFIHEGIQYQYGFAATPGEIVGEWLHACPQVKSQNWFSREGQGDWKFSRSLLGERKKLSERTRKNALFLSVAAQWNHKQLTPVYEWFKKLRVVSSNALLGPVTENILMETKQSSEISRLISKSLKGADFGIDNFRWTPFNANQLSFPDDMPDDIRKIITQQVIEEHPITVECVHKIKGTKEKVAIPLEEESEGTQKFFKLIGPWLDAIVGGYTIFYDELESHLHPLLTRQLIQLIQSQPDSRTQLVFATHDTTLLDPDLFRRDQVWFTEKNGDGETNLYSLAEYKNKPRKGEALQKGYLSGRYGAIPILEAFSVNG